MNIVLYSTHCPKCEILTKKLNSKNIIYDEVDDINEMLQRGFMEAPVLEVDGKFMNYVDANKWINNYKGDS